MAIHAAIERVTRHRHDRPLAHAPHVIRLHPAPHTRTPVHDYHLDVDAPSHRVYWQDDPFWNRVARVVFLTVPA